MSALQLSRETNPERWLAAITQLPNHHPLQGWEWAEHKQSWGWRMHPYLWRSDNGTPRAAAMVLQRPLGKLPGGRSLLSLLYVPRGPALDWSDKPLRQRVLDDLQRIARQKRAILLKVDPFLARATGEEPHLNPTGIQVEADLTQRGWRISAEQIQFRNTVLLDLTPDEDELLRSFKQKTRYNIRYAGRKEVKVRPAADDELPTIAELYATTAQRNEFTIRPPAYYLDYWRAYRAAGRGEVLVATYEERLLAAAVLLQCGAVTIYKDGASAEIERKRMPTYLLQWEGIRWAKAHGSTSYDFWGAPDRFEPDDDMWGVWRFKSGFNGTVMRTLGAWDYAPARPLYRAYTVALPRYRAWLRRRLN